MHHPSLDLLAPKNTSHADSSSDYSIISWQPCPTTRRWVHSLGIWVFGECLVLRGPASTLRSPGTASRSSPSPRPRAVPTRRPPAAQSAHSAWPACCHWQYQQQSLKAGFCRGRLRRRMMMPGKEGKAGGSKGEQRGKEGSVGSAGKERH